MEGDPPRPFFLCRIKNKCHGFDRLVCIFFLLLITTTANVALQHLVACGSMCAHPLHSLCQRNTSRFCAQYICHWIRSTHPRICVKTTCSQQTIRILPAVGSLQHQLSSAPWIWSDQCSVHCVQIATGLFSVFWKGIGCQESVACGT